MPFKRALNGLTLVEILLSLIVASMILLYLVPQQLQSRHEQLVNKTVAQMNQIVLAARNYYQESRAASLINAPNASYWPQTLNDLSTKAYLPAAALCSPWPSDTTSTTCKNAIPYVIFPNNGSGQYDTNAPGILAVGQNRGGNFWGVSLTLPNAKIAEEVRQKLPFSSLCAVSQLKTGASCSNANTSTTVTAIVPRPSLWPQQVTNLTYANDGLIQSMGLLVMCDNTYSSTTCDQTANQVSVKSTITMPTTCNNNTTPVLFVYPSNITTRYEDNRDAKNINDNNLAPGVGNYFPGISLKTTRDDVNHQWLVQAQNSSNTKKYSIGAKRFRYMQIIYFTVCAPAGDPNKWDLSNFSGASGNGVNW